MRFCYQWHCHHKSALLKWNCVGRFVQPRRYKHYADANAPHCYFIRTLPVLLYQAFCSEFPSSERSCSAESRCQIVRQWLLFVTLNIMTRLCTDAVLTDAIYWNFKETFISNISILCEMGGFAKPYRRNLLKFQETFISNISILCEMGGFAKPYRRNLLKFQRDFHK